MVRDYASKIGSTLVFNTQQSSHLDFDTGKTQLHKHNILYFPQILLSWRFLELKYIGTYFVLN